MKHAIATLTTTMEILANNEPIHRAEGNIEQADLDTAAFNDCTYALGFLRKGPGRIEQLETALRHAINRLETIQETDCSGLHLVEDIAFLKMSTTWPLQNSPAQPINIIFDAAPGLEAGRFIEVETDDGKSINAGSWHARDDGKWALRITELPKS